MSVWVIHVEPEPSVSISMEDTFASVPQELEETPTAIVAP